MGCQPLGRALAKEMHLQGPTGLWELGKGREAREESIYLFIQQTFITCLLCSKCSSCHWEDSNEQDTRGACTHRAHVLETVTWSLGTDFIMKLLCPCRCPLAHPLSPRMPRLAPTSKRMPRIPSASDQPCKCIFIL